MNYKLVLKTYSQLRQLTDDETALLNTLRGMTDAEREMLAETLGPVAKSKPAKPAAKRAIEHCGVCNWTRRAAVHKDTSLSDYHDFVSAKPTTKSKRASSLQQVIKGTAGGNHKPSLCAFEVDGKVCHGEEGDAIHDETMGYSAYHPFVSSLSARNAVGQSSMNDDEVNSETGSEDVSVAAGGGD